MTTGKPHIDEITYRRYLNHEMTNAERNAFEKELQKNSFEAEALEGLELVSGSDLEKNLSELKIRIGTKRRKNRTSYFAVAATILLLVTAGVIWMQLDKQDPVQKMTETKIEQEAKTEKAPEPIQKENAEKPAPVIEQREEDTQKKKATDVTTRKKIQVHEKAAAPKSALIVQEKEAIIQEAEADIEVEVKTFEMVDDEITLAAPKVRPANKASVQKAGSVVQGKVVSADDQLPIPGVSIIEKGTDNGVVTDMDGHFQLQLRKDSNTTLVASFVGMEANEFQPNRDSDNLVKLESSELALDEVVVVGYGTQKQQAVTSSVTVVETEADNSEATPLGGYKSYYEYLYKNALLPDDFAEKKRVVKLQVKLDENGNIVAIKNANNADKEFFNKAKELVEKGPEWQPELFNGRKVKSQVKLRIVFRKAED
uniref:carboxypeptidase-like regulatory domain-containing protein n=1 Tax=uncultured Draconibacterium sp. TaxID=1573823 RepID=UPI003216DA27